MHYSYPIDTFLYPHLHLFKTLLKTFKTLNIQHYSNTGLRDETHTQVSRPRPVLKRIEFLRGGQQTYLMVDPL